MNTKRWRSTLLVTLAAVVAGCVVDPQMVRRAMDPEAVRREQEEERHIQERNAREAAYRAEVAQREKAEQESKEQGRKQEEAQRTELIRRHRSNGGFLIGKVGPACVYRPDTNTALAAARTLTDFYVLSQCMSYSSSKASVEVSFLNDTQKPIKDLKVKCILVAPSGTSLGGYSTSIIYEKWEPGDIKVFEVEAPLYQQAKGAKCTRIG